jgi:hypothetical protein
MGTTPTNNAATPVEEEYKLIDDGAGDPSDAGAIRYVSNRFRLRDNNGVHYDTDVRASSTDTTPATLSAKLVGDGIDISISNQGNDEDVKLSTSATSPGPYTFYLDAGMLGRCGNSGEVVVFGYHGAEFAASKTDFGTHSVYWTRGPTTSVKLYVLFTPKYAASGYVRIGAKVKSKAVGEAMGGAFDVSSFVAVNVTGVAAGTLAPLASITLSPAVFSSGDGVSFHIGRDGSNTMGGGQNDTSGKAIYLVAIGIEVI